MQKISVIGLGKLGTPLLVTLASRGFKVTGVDLNKNFVEKIKKAKPPIDEPKIGGLLKTYRVNITATSNYPDAIKQTDISFVIVPTPSAKNGAFSNDHVLFAAKSIAKVLKDKKTFHLVAIVSTVIPGSMEGEIIPTLEKFSGKKAGVDFGVCYNPEFIALGSVVDNLLKPDLVLIGQLNIKSGDILESVYKNLCVNNPPIAKMNLVNAEITKISLNSFITTKISFANTIAQICSRQKGANVEEVTKTLGLDSRIGPKYLKGALPFGGPCFPRDNRAFAHFAKKLKLKAPLAEASDRVNTDLIKILAKEIAKHKSTIGILGLAYKKDTDVAEESAGVKLANQLSKAGKKVYVWDPKASKDAKKYLSPEIIVAKTLDECVQRAGLIAIATPWDEFRKINFSKFKNNPHKKTVVDFWKIIDRKKYLKFIDYKTVGEEKYKINGTI